MEVSNEITGDPVPSFWITQPMVTHIYREMRACCRKFESYSQRLVNYSCNMLCWSPEMVKMASIHRPEVRFPNIKSYKACSIILPGLLTAAFIYN